MPEKYSEYEFGIVRESDGAFIPRDKDNRDYAAWLKQRDTDRENTGK